MSSHPVFLQVPSFLRRFRQVCPEQQRLFSSGDGFPLQHFLTATIDAVDQVGTAPPSSTDPNDLAGRPA
jgi:hypothetical protein